MSSVSTEQVLVVPTELFHEIGYVQGFSDEASKYLTGLLQSDQVSYRPRGEMEEDPTFKQLIPYVIFRYTTPEGEQQVFEYTRGKGQGEKRLHSKKSVGIGGHISLEDRIDKNEGYHTTAYAEGMKRELQEEVTIGAEYTQYLAGIINDDTQPVGRVHLGIVHIFDVKEPVVKPNEKDLLEAQFTPVEELLDQLDQFETWSQICLEALFGNRSS
ncbi:MAG: NUDIX domain-containing protein [Pirellulaceae bacterium]|nr:NUDIX domain-containing protein [Pirellulaceae bacterium]